MDDKSAWLYLRISDDRGGEALGIARQRRDGRALAARRGWTVAGEFVDNDVSATRAKRRPAYEDLLDAIRDGRVKAVIVWDVDRLTRKPAELETFIDLAERHGVQLASVGGEIDLSTPQGQLTARIKGSVARHEAQQLQRRILAKVTELADAGKIANGGPRPFGYTRVFAGEGPRRRIVKDEINPGEAVIVRECATRALAGDSLRSIVGDLNNRGVKTSTGRPWTKQALRLMLRSGRIAGLRERDDKVVATAVWPAIIDVDQHKTLRALLDSNERPPGSRVRIHYLTGSVYCSACVDRGVKMGSITQAGKLKYRCAPKQEGGCNGRIIGLSELQDMVDVYMIAKLSDPETLREISARESNDDTHEAELVAEIEKGERRIAVLRDQIEDVEADEAEVADTVASMRKIRRRVAKARSEFAALSATPDVAKLDLPELARRWRGLHVDQKVRLLRTFVDKIVIHPAKRGLGRFDPDRVDIIPKRVATGRQSRVT